MPKPNYPKTAVRDMPDVRDYIYEPALLQLQPELGVPEELVILDQKSEGACTGFSLAAVINLLKQRRGNARGNNRGVSARMLYEMAKLYDQWPGEDYQGSSLRGAIEGWKNMGVCDDSLWKYRISRPGQLSIRRAKNARENTLGAYYRLRPIISHFHAALNEVGVIAVSAQVHRGWDEPQTGTIEFFPTNVGGHAFAVVGYNSKGFWVQNSWGKFWGQSGLALWLYEDWIKNVMDAWVIRLALPTPQIFGLRPQSSRLLEGQTDRPGKSATRRSIIAGHFVHIDDGLFHETGKYWSSAWDIEQTARYLSEESKYRHLLVYCHGGLNNPEMSAERIAAMKDGFKRNGIYPFHIMYDTGLAEELRDLILNKAQFSRERVGGFSDWTDRFLEGLLRRPGSLLWQEMKQDAARAFGATGAGTESLQYFLRYFGQGAKRGIRKKIHLVGHSLGSVVIAHLLRILQRRKLTISSLSLLAPACSLDLYHSHYLPILQGKRNLKIKRLNIYNLRDNLEQDDNVALVYRKSLLYLVSRSFEQTRELPLLGMERYSSLVRKAGAKPSIHFSDAVAGSVTRSRTHTGFDNDPVTMNHILQTVLGQAPEPGFGSDELAD